MPNFFLSHKRAKVADCVAGPWRMWIAPKSKRARRDLAQGPPESAQSLPAGASQERWAMKFFPGLAVSAALVCAAPAADAQMLAPYDAGKGRLVSGVDGSYVDGAGAPPPVRRGLCYSAA